MLSWTAKSSSVLSRTFVTSVCLEMVPYHACIPIAAIVASAMRGAPTSLHIHPIVGRLVSMQTPQCSKRVEGVMLVPQNLSLQINRLKHDALRMRECFRAEALLCVHGCGSKAVNVCSLGEDCRMRGGVGCWQARWQLPGRRGWRKMRRGREMLSGTPSYP